MRISGRHFHSGTSKWNKIKHRMFCHITQNWRGRPLICPEIVVNQIGAVTTKELATIQSALDEIRESTGRKATPEEKQSLSVELDALHGGWIDTLAPRAKLDEIICLESIGALRVLG